MFMYVIQYNCLIYFILVCCSLSLLCIFYSTTPSLLHLCFINMFVNVISIVTAICLSTSYNLLLGCATSWESCLVYFLYNICHCIIVILVDLHSLKYIKTLLFELVFVYIKTHIFVPALSIFHLFISIRKFFCSFVIFYQLFTLSLQPFTTLKQHHISLPLSEYSVFCVSYLATCCSNAMH